MISPNDAPCDARRFFSASELPTPLEQHSAFCFGDLNYRLTIPNREVRYRFGQRNWVDTLVYDQLRTQLGEPGTAFEAWDEADIDFRPTYKYDVGTSDFDTSGKARAPAWCDRCLLYTSPSPRDRTRSRMPSSA